MQRNQSNAHSEISVKKLTVIFVSRWWDLGWLPLYFPVLSDFFFKCRHILPLDSYVHLGERKSSTWIVPNCLRDWAGFLAPEPSWAALCSSAIVTHPHPAPPVPSNQPLLTSVSLQWLFPLLACFACIGVLAVSPLVLHTLGSSEDTHPSFPVQWQISASFTFLWAFLWAGQGFYGQGFSMGRNRTINGDWSWVIYPLTCTARPGMVPRT